MRRLLPAILLFGVGGCAGHPAADVSASSESVAATETVKKERKSKMDEPKVAKTEEEWRKDLSPEQYHVLREKGTERAFTGKYWNLKEDGAYECAGCGTELFKSDTKYDSGCGWPSFYDAPDKSKLDFHEDLTYGMRRIEVTCANCGGHLGHVFPDGPEPTGLRYCINSAALDFEPKKS